MAFSIRKEEPRHTARQISNGKNFGFSNYVVDTNKSDRSESAEKPVVDPNEIIKERAKRFVHTGEEKPTRPTFKREKGQTFLSKLRSIFFPQCI